MFNKVILIGRLVADPQLRHTGSDVPVASFRIAVDRPRRSGDAEKSADFIDIVAWRQRGEFAAQYFKKGMLVLAEGSLQMRKWKDKDGNNRISSEVVADNLQFAEPKGRTEETDERPSEQSDFGDDDLPF